VSCHAPYKRVVVKLSGESFCRADDDAPGREESSGPHQRIHAAALGRLVAEIGALADAGVQTAVVVGAGNILRGRTLREAPIHRTTADAMGMLATLINALALRDALEAAGRSARVLSARVVEGFCEPFSRDRALAALAGGRVVLFAAGTGHPFFTTDTAAALRAGEIGADLLIKATQVDGVFDADPVGNPGAHKYERLSFARALAEEVGVMDLTAIVLCRDNNIPIRVVQLCKGGSLLRAARGEDVGTLVDADG